MKTEVFFYIRDKKGSSYLCDLFIEHETSYEVKEGNWHHIKRIIEKKYTRDRILEIYNEEQEDYSSFLKAKDLEEVSPVYRVVVTPWIEGTYFSERFPEKEYLEGRARKIHYSNDFICFEVECLDEGVDNSSKFWTNLYSDGAGDTFEPFEKINILRW